MGQINRCGSSAIKATGETTLRSWQERNTNAGRNNKYSNLNWRSVCVCGTGTGKELAKSTKKHLKKKKNILVWKTCYGFFLKRGSATQLQASTEFGYQDGEKNSKFLRAVGSPSRFLPQILSNWSQFHWQSFLLHLQNLNKSLTKNNHPNCNIQM